MGLISSGTSYGVFINGLLVSFLTLHGGWRSIWLSAGLISVALCVAAWFCCATWMQARPRLCRRTFDIARQPRGSAVRCT
jgi:MFS family permease